MFNFFKKKPSKLDESISLARKLLDMQVIRFMCLSADEITPHLSNDAWAQGYVMGLLDAISQEAGFDQAENLTYMMLSYIRIFGETTGTEFFQQIEYLQSTEDFINGMSAGGQELMLFIYHKQSPNGLGEHLYN
jgi:hypothetical protein